MCGLIGFSAPKGKQFNLDKLRLLFMWNQERGRHSYGFYTPTIGIIKDTGTIEDQMCKKDFNIPDSNLFIGHVRSATIGATNKANAHPFNFGNIVLAMNGTLSNTWDLCREYGFPLADFDVDSQLLTAILNKDQNKSVLSKILGGCALVYTDTNTGRLYCYRNSDRPLYRGNIGGAMYISSIENSLKVIGCLDVKEFKVDNLYEIKDGAVIGTYKVKRAVAKPITTSNYDVSSDENGLFLNVGFARMKSEELIGKWLKIKVPYHSNTPAAGFTKGFAYEVLSGTDKEWEIVVLNDNKEAVTVSKYSFEEKFPILSAGDYVFSKNTMDYNKPEDGQFAAEGDLLLLLRRNKTTFYAKNVMSGESATIEPDEVRFAYPDEVKYIKRLYYIGDDDTIKTPVVTAETSITNQEEKKPKSEEEAWEDEVKKTEFNTFEECAHFTISELDGIISDLKEIELNPNVSNKVKRLEILTMNFNDKVTTLNLV